MTLQEQVCTLEQAQRLKELGCEQESYFKHGKSKTLQFDGRRPLGSAMIEVISERPEQVIASAYTVAELGEMLVQAGQYVMPVLVNLPTTIANPEIRTNEKAYYHKFLQLSKPDEIYGGLDMYFHTEAQARAALLIHILEKEQQQ